MRYAIVYGAIAGGIVVAFSGLALATGTLGHSTSPLIGYLIMLVALTMIFIGVKRYRDIECGGTVRFGRALIVGLGIALVAALFYVVGWEVYFATAGQNFMADYSRAMVEEMRQGGASQSTIDAAVAQMDAFAVQYRNPLYRVPLTFIEIFPVGLVVALVSAALLRNPRLLPAVVR
jgi:hypothetical protein